MNFGEDYGTISSCDFRQKYITLWIETPDEALKEATNVLVQEANGAAYDQKLHLDGDHSQLLLPLEVRNTRIRCNTKKLSRKVYIRLLNMEGIGNEEVEISKLSGYNYTNNYKKRIENRKVLISKFISFTFDPGGNVTKERKIQL